MDDWATYLDGERVPQGNRHLITTADHRNQRARTTSITHEHLSRNSGISGRRGENISRKQNWLLANYIPRAKAGYDTC